MSETELQEVIFISPRRIDLEATTVVQRVLPKTTIEEN